MSKEDKISLEDLDEMTDEEAQDLSKEEKAELMKQAGKRRDRELSISTAEKIGLTYPDRKKQDIEYEVDERYDEGGVEEKKAPFDYTKFFRKRRADGGAIGVESLFEEKVPAAPSQLVEESEIVLGYRGPGGYQGGRSSRSGRSGPSRGPAGGASAGGNYGGNRNPSQTYGGSIFRGGGGGGQTTTPTPTPTKKGAFVNPFTGLKQHFINNAMLEQAVKAGKITPEQYNIMGGIDVKETMGLGPVDAFITAGIYNALQSALGPKFTRGNQPLMEGIADTMRVTKGAAGRAPELMNTYENIIGQNLADGGSVDLTIVRMPDITELGVESLFKTR
jgi:hypothetical protein